MALAQSDPLSLPHAPLPEEVARMPRYCQVKMGMPGSASEESYWRQRFGGLWIDMHHFCQGLKDLQRGGRVTASKEFRSYYNQYAASEFKYIIDSRNAKGHWFLPEAHSYRGLALMKAGRHAEAAAEYKAAEAAKRQVGAAH